MTNQEVKSKLKEVIYDSWNTSKKVKFNLSVRVALLSVHFEIKELPKEDDPLGFLYQLISKRIKYYSYDLTNEAIITLVILFSSPGKIVMALTYLQFWSEENNKDIIDVQDLIELFNDALPMKEVMEKSWEDQKLNGDNLVDLVLPFNSHKPT